MPRLREQWFYEQRAYPNKAIPGGARLKALERREEMRLKEKDRSPFSRVEGQVAVPQVERLIQANLLTWTPIGPRPTDSPFFGLVSGRTPAIAADPTNDNIVYIGGAQGGVWKTTDGGQNWTPLTDDQSSLAIGAIAIDPSSCTPAPCKTIYVGTGEQTFSGSSYYGAGILKSTDGGQSWTHLPGVFNPPVTVNLIQQGGTATFSSFLGPLSAGFTPGGGARISSLAVKKDGSVVLAGVQLFVSADSGASSGIYRSTDGGVTWTQVQSGAAGTEVLFDPQTPNISYASLGTPQIVLFPSGGIGVDPDNGVYRSTDSGQSWTKIGGAGTLNWPGTDIGRIEVAIAPSSASTLYAGVSNVQNDSLLAFLKSTNGGSSWTNLTANVGDYCIAQCSYDHVVRVHPNNANVVYVGGAASRYLRRSTDGGTTWTTITASASGGPPVHVDQHAMAFGIDANGAATKLYLGNDGGVWVADVSNATGAITWTNLNSGLQLSQFYPRISIHPSDDQTSIGGTQDNGTQIFSGNLQWKEVTCGDGGSTAYEPQMPTTVYASCQSVPFFQLRRSLRNGEITSTTSSWLGGLSNGIDPNDRADFIPPLVHDPNLPNRLYFGTHRIYQSNDRMDHWTPISQDLTQVTGSPQGVITAIAVAPSDSSIVYSGSSTGRILRTLNAGAGANAVWIDLTSIPQAMQMPQRTVTSLAVDPNNPLIVYATYSGFSGIGPLFQDNLGHVFKGTFSAQNPPSSAQWSDISGAVQFNLPNTPANAIVVDPGDPTSNTLYVGTDVGIFVTTMGGFSSWSTLVTGLPNVAVLGLELRQASRTLRAATHGRGMWDLQLPGLPAFALTAISPLFADLSGGSFTLNVRGAGFTPSTVVQWNGNDVTPTTCPDANNCSVLIPSSFLSPAGTAAVAVFDPATGASNALNFVVLGFSSAPAPPNDNFANAISVALAPFTDTQDSVNATTEPNDPAPPVAGTSPCTDVTSSPNNGRSKSIWYRFRPTQNGQITADTFGSIYDSILVVVTGSQNGTVVACNDDPDDSSSPSRVTLSATANTDYFFMISAWDGSGGSTTFSLSFVGPPPNDDVQNAALVSGPPFPYTNSVDSAAATTQTTDPAISSACSLGAANSGRAKTVWYRLTIGGVNTAVADTKGSGYDTVLSVYTGSPGAFTLVACDDDSGGNFTSQVVFNSIPGTTYYFMVSDYDGVGGPTVFTMASFASLGSSFSVTANPPTVTVTRGQTASTQITITPENGTVAASITFACVNLPSQATCTFSPPSVTPGGNPQTVTVTFGATAPSHAPPRTAPPVTPWPLLWLALAMLFAAMGQMLLQRRRKMRLVHAVVFLAVIGLLAAMVACGGGGGSSGPPPNTNPGTPTGSFAVNIVGTSGQTTNFTTITLAVQ